MAQTHHYSHPTTPAGAGTDTVISGAVQVDPQHQFAAAAALGDSAILGINVDDPAGAYDFKGLWRWYVIEGDCPSDDHYAFNGYIATQGISRGFGTGTLFPNGAGRRWDLEINELSSLAGFRVVSGDDGNRPAETIGDRLTWLIGTVYLPVTDNGLITYDTTDLDANDYRGQRAADVLNDMANIVGFNWWIYYDQAAADGDEVSLAFFDPNDDSLYPAAISISNDPDDIDLDSSGVGTVFPPSEDAVVERNPDKIAAGVYLPYAGGAIYEFSNPTSYEFAFRDQVAPTASIKTEAKAIALADRFLDDNDEQDERAHLTLRLPSSQLNDVKHGQLINCKFTHVPDWEDGKDCRVVRKTFGPPDNRTQKFYDVALELSPIKVVSSPSGAADAGVVGIGFSGIPELPRQTTPGNVLFMIVFAAGQTDGNFPTEIRMLDNPPTSGSPSVPPFSALQSAAWTVITTATTDYGGMNIGGPGAGWHGPYNGAAGSEGYGMLVGAAWRYVQPGEFTTTPVQVSTEIGGTVKTVAYLWELPTTTPPTGVFETLDGRDTSMPCNPSLPSMTGNIVAAFHYPLAAGHSTGYSGGNPLSGSATSPGTVLRQMFTTGFVGDPNDDTTYASTPNTADFSQIILLPTGGVAAATVTTGVPGSAYTSLNWCGIAVELPAGITLPDIPYPGNQSA